MINFLWRKHAGVSTPAVALTSDPFCALSDDSNKVLDFFNEINSLRWNLITVGNLCKLYWIKCAVYPIQPSASLPFQTLVMSWPWWHSAWALYWICFSFDLLLIYLVLCAASFSIGYRWVFIVSLVVSLITWL